MNIKEKKKIIVVSVLVVVVCMIFSAVIIFLNEDKLQRNNKNLLVDNQNNYTSTEEMIKSILSKDNDVPEVSTKYSILYKDENNRHSYIFANPVRKSVDNEYIYCDINIEKSDYGYSVYNANYSSDFYSNSIRLSQNGGTQITFDISGSPGCSLSEDYINVYSEAKKSVRYVQGTDISLYVTPTYSGLLFEYNIDNSVKQFKCKIDIGDLDYENEDAGYVMLEKDEVEKAIVHRPIIADTEAKLHVLNEIQIKREGDGIYLVADIPDNIECRKLAFHLDYYTEKMFFDTSAYQSTSGVNSLFSNISIFDTSGSDDGCYTYMKFNLRSYTPQKSSLVDSVVLNMYALDVKGETTIEVYKVPGDWCSWTLSWKNKPDFKKQIGEFTITESGWYSIDLTDYVKELIDDDYDRLIDNSIVFKIKDETSGYAVFASTDNTYAPPYFDIKYRVK